MSRLLALAAAALLLIGGAACSGSSAGPGSVTSVPLDLETPLPPTAEDEPTAEHEAPETGDDGLAYIALGDSLSAGIGASDPHTNSFVPLVAESLGEGHVLRNLGHSGDTSSDLLDHGHLDEAIAMIERRNGDGDESNDVALVTLEIGGNDLLRLYFSFVLTGQCPRVESVLASDECGEPLASALDAFEPNLTETLDRLREADPAVPIVLLTLYNPFPSFFGPRAEIAELALEGMAGTPFEEGLNDIIRRQAAERGVPVVDLYPVFEGRAAELVSSDFIHPNDRGYREMADAVIEALASQP